MTGWQPIETAPRDTAFLGYRAGPLGALIEVVCLIRWEGDDRDSFVQRACSGRRYLGFMPAFRPTHWQPLPDPPHATHESRDSRHPQSASLAKAEGE